MADDIEKIFELTSALRAARELDDRLQALVDRTGLLLNVVRVAAYLLNPEQTRLVATARAGLPIHRAPVEYRMGEGLLGWVAQERQTLRTGDAESDPRFLTRPGMTSRIGSFVGVPLLGRSAVLGVLSATDPEPNAFTQHQERLLVIAAAIGAPLIESLRDR